LAFCSPACTERCAGETRERNGVLIFVAPLSKRFAVIGDTGIRARCGPKFWEEMAGEMTAHFRQVEFTRGIIGGIKKAAEFLALHFPRGRMTRMN
jgi:uncharacterized membrane protein